MLKGIFFCTQENIILVKEKLKILYPKDEFLYKPDKLETWICMTNRKRRNEVWTFLNNLTTEKLRQFELILTQIPIQTLKELQSLYNNKYNRILTMTKNKNDAQKMTSIVKELYPKVIVMYTEIPHDIFYFWAPYKTAYPIISFLGSLQPKYGNQEGVLLTTPIKELKTMKYLYERRTQS